MKFPPKTWLPAIAVILVFSACKKYPEDGKRSWRTPMHRIDSHSWSISGINIDGADSIHSPGYAPIAHMVIAFKPDNLIYYQNNSYYKELTISGTPFNVSNRNYWHFTDSKSEVYLVSATYVDPGSSYSGTYTYNSYYYNGAIIPYASIIGNTWEIRKLTSTELILELKSGGHVTRLSFNN